MWNVLNKPIFGTRAPEMILFQWREPFTARLQYHRDYATRLIMAAATAFSVGCLFYIAGFAETQDIVSGLIAGAFGFIFFGFFFSLVIVLGPESILGNQVRIQETKITRRRKSLAIYGYIDETETWPKNSLHARIVFAQDLHLGFSIMVLSPEDEAIKRGIAKDVSALVYVPLHVDLIQLVSHLEQAGVKVTRVTPDTLKSKPPYHRFWPIALVSLATVAFGAAIFATFR